MQLRFLGAAYTPHWPKVESYAGEVSGKYRGVAWCTKHHTAPVVTTEPVTLHFMGRSYRAQI